MLRDGRESIVLTFGVRSGPGIWHHDRAVLFRYRSLYAVAGEGNMPRRYPPGAIFVPRGVALVDSQGACVVGAVGG